MMGSRPVRESAEVVIWGATSLLGIMVGVGTAFMLWSQLHNRNVPVMLDAAVIALAVGLGLIGVAVTNAPTRVFLWVLAGAFVLAFFAGGGAFAALTN